jgi:putative ABC transport system permease protein
MLNGFYYGLKKFWFDLRSGDLIILFSSIVLAVTAISGVSFLGDRLQSSIKQQASVVLAADMAFRSASPLPDDYLTSATNQGLGAAKTVSFLSMALANNDNLLASIKATTSTYPLRGSVALKDFKGEVLSNEKGTPNSGYIWVEPKLVDALNLKQNNQLVIGNRSFVVEAILDDYPDRNVGFLAFSPTIIANIADLKSMGVIQTGSRVVYRQLFSGTEKQINLFFDSVSNLPEEVRVQRLDEVGDQLGRTLDRSTRFFNLAGLFTIVIAAISSMIAARRYATRHLLNTTLMKVFGASKKFILSSQICQLLIMIFLATTVGLCCGYLIQSLLISLLDELIGNDLPPPSLKPVSIGFLTSFSLVFAATAPYLKLLGEVEPIRILRDDFTFHLKNNIGVYTLAILTLTVFLLVLLEDVSLVLSILGAMCVLVIVLSVLGYFVVWLLSLYSNVSGLGWRMGLRNISRRRNTSVLQIVVFGLSLTFLMVLTETRTDLIESWKETLKEDTPNYFFFNIQDYETDDINSFFKGKLEQPITFTPLIRGRLLGVTSTSGEPLKAQNMIDREANLTWFDALPENNLVVEGEWWLGDVGAPSVSIDKDIAASMNLSIGDRLSFTAGGMSFEATVSSFREVQWESFAPNFFFILSPGLGKDLPQSFITSLNVPPDSKVADEFIKRFPTVTSVDLEAALSQIRSIVNSASLAVQAIFILSLFAGILTLVAAIFSSVDQRKKETAVIHTMGATRRKIFSAIAAEFLGLGILSGLTAVLAAILFSGFLLTQIFELSYTPNLSIYAVGFFIGLTSITITGMLAVRKAIYSPAVLTLRS